jgi:hypothetical protein
MAAIRGADQKPVDISGYMDNAPAPKLRLDTALHGRPSTKIRLRRVIVSVDMQKNILSVRR